MAKTLRRVFNLFHSNKISKCDISKVGTKSCGMAFEIKFSNFKGCMLKLFYIFRLLLGLRSNWDKEYIQLFGETWNYGDGLAGKTLEGFFESGPQLILQTHIQHLTSWPTMQPLIQGTLTKAYYFSSQKPGELN